MAYTQGQTIEAVDYNNLGNQLASYWGTGTGRWGVGASTSSFANVALGNTVTATQWTGLFQSTNNALSHEGQTTIAPTSVTVGQPITAYAALSTGINAVGTHMGSVSSVSDGTTTNTDYTSSWGGSGNRNLVFTQTVTFSSADEARYFFNAGGNIKLSFSRSGGSATTRNSEWTDLCNQCGTVVIGYLNTTRLGGGPTAPTTLLNSNNGGYWNSSTTAVNHFKQYADTSPYTINFLSVEVKLGGSTTNGGYSEVTITTYWENDYANVFQQTVDGTCRTSLVLSSPTTTYIGSATWGTPVVSGSVIAT